MAKQIAAPQQPRKASSSPAAPNLAKVKAGKRNLDIDVRFTVDFLTQPFRPSTLCAIRWPT